MRSASIIALLSLACLLAACTTQSQGRGRGNAAGPAAEDSATGGRRGRGARQGGARGAGRGQVPLSRNVQIRRYRFDETGESLEYAVYVSSKVTKDSKKIPLVIALHGRGAHPTTIMRHAQGPAEQLGWVVAAPMGYNDHGWYGLLESERTTPAHVREYSEKDVMNVLSFMRNEFDIDENRIYLMGTSMGGAGVLFLAVKHSDIWAAVAAGAPPLRRATHGETIAGIPNVRHLPMMLVHGSRDAAVTVEVSRRTAGNLQQLGTPYEYREIPGGTHPDAGRVGAPWMFSFFEKHIKAAPSTVPGLLLGPTPAAQPMNSTMIPLPESLRNGTAPVEQIGAWIHAEHKNVYPEIPIDSAPFRTRELDLDLDGVNDRTMQRYGRTSAGGAHSAFLKTPRGYRFIGSFVGDIRPLPLVAGQRGRFVVTSPMGSGKVHVRLAELRADGLHQLATAILAAGDSGSAEGNRLYRDLMSADVDLTGDRNSESLGSIRRPKSRSHLKIERFGRDHSPEVHRAPNHFVSIRGSASPRWRVAQSASVQPMRTYGCSAGNLEKCEGPRREP